MSGSVGLGDAVGAADVGGAPVDVGLKFPGMSGGGGTDGGSGACGLRGATPEALRPACGSPPGVCGAIGATGAEGVWGRAGIFG